MRDADSYGLPDEYQGLRSDSEWGGGLQQPFFTGVPTRGGSSQPACGSTAMAGVLHRGSALSSKSSSASSSFSSSLRVTKTLHLSSPSGKMRLGQMISKGFQL